ncbi:MAG: DoxX family protein [Planctomycetes bacterium]|nr:DoxX family protein [Planctomycetota bacterium]
MFGVDGAGEAQAMSGSNALAGNMIGDAIAAHSRARDRLIGAASVLGQAALATVFVVAGVHKVMDGPGNLLAMLGALGWSDSVWIAQAIPFFEITVGCWLASGRLPRACGWVTLTCLFVLSATLVLLGNKIGWREQCGCMGPFSRGTIQEGLIRNGALILIAIGLLIGYRFKKSHS